MCDGRCTSHSGFGLHTSLSRQHIVQLVLVWSLLRRSLDTSTTTGAMLGESRATIRTSRDLVEIGALSLTLFTNPTRPHREYPCLSSRVKAAASRHLVPILASIFDDVCDHTSEEDCRVSALLNALKQVYDAMDCREQNLPPRQLAIYHGKMAECMEHYRWLCARALSEDRRMWNDVPKQHFCLHLAEQAAQQNPRFCWTYPDEDFMGYVKRIMESCLSGTRAHRAVTKLLEKWAFGVAMRLTR